MSFSLFGALAGIIALGGAMSFWLRRFHMQGFEIWLSMCIIVSYAVSPFVGYITAMLIISISFMLFPFDFKNIFVMGTCLAGIAYSTLFFPVTIETFAWTGMKLVFSYIAVSTILTTLIGYPLVRNARFIVLSLVFNYLLFTQMGWTIFTFLQSL